MTHTKDEALKLALEALERYQVKRQDFDRFADEITAIKQALAAPVQQSRSDVEPVAWIVYAKGSRKYFTLTFDPNKVPEIYIGGEAVPLYTTPPNVATPPAAQRQWVGLTPDDIRQLEKENTVGGLDGDYCPTWDLIESVEAKLKEKNT
jgi:hypothetical protein